MSDLNTDGGFEMKIKYCTKIITAWHPHYIQRHLLCCQADIHIIPQAFVRTRGQGGQDKNCPQSTQIDSNYFYRSISFPKLRLDCLTLVSSASKFVGLIHFNFPVLFGLISICFRRANYFTRVSWERRDTALETIKPGLESLKSGDIAHDFTPAAPLKRKTFRRRKVSQIVKYWDTLMVK